MDDNIGERFHAMTKYARGNLPRHMLDWDKKPSVYKEYNDVPKIPLPKPNVTGGGALWEIIERRRSVRAYAEIPISLEQVSQLLWATQGITGRVGGYELRAAPSAGALYPIETYLSVHKVTGIEQGLYHYTPSSHYLDQLKKGDYSTTVASSALDQQMAKKAPLVFIWSAVFPRSKWKYLQRAYRYVFLDAGHIAQNLALASESLGLSSCQIAAIYDNEMNVLLDIDGESESVIYLSVVGKSR